MNKHLFIRCISTKTEHKCPKLNTIAHKLLYFKKKKASLPSLDSKIYFSKFETPNMDHHSTLNVEACNNS